MVFLQAFIARVGEERNGTGEGLQEFNESSGYALTRYNRLVYNQCIV